MQNLKNPKLILILLCSIGLDLWSKRFMSHWLQFGHSKPVIPGFFDFTLVHNRGAAFGVGSGLSTPVFLLFSVIALVVVVYLFWSLKPEEKLSGIGLAMILGGAFGNIFDRIRMGYVVDFLDVYVKNYHWPVFNIADSLITVGAILIGIDMLFHSKKSTNS